MSNNIRSQLFLGDKYFRFSENLTEIDIFDKKS